VADVPSGLSLTPPQETKKKSIFLLQELSRPNRSSYATVGAFDFCDILTLVGHAYHSRIII
jgi:hypothetical protein